MTKPRKNGDDPAEAQAAVARGLLKLLDGGPDGGGDGKGQPAANVQALHQMMVAYARHLGADPATAGLVERRLALRGPSARLRELADDLFKVWLFEQGFLGG